MSDPQGKHSVDWLALSKLLAPVVGELAGHGDRGAFMHGFYQQQQVMDEHRKQQAEADQKLKATGADFLMHAGEHGQGITNPAEYENFLASVEAAGVPAKYIQPGQARAAIPFNKAGQMAAEKKDAFAALKQLIDINGPDIVHANVLTDYKGQRVTPQVLARLAGVEATDPGSGQTYQAPPKPAGSVDERAGALKTQIRAATAAGDTATAAKLQAQYDDIVSTAGDLSGAKRATPDAYNQQLDTTFKELRNQIASTNANKGGAAAGGGLTPEGIDYAATQYRVTGSMPPLGMASTGARTAVVNAAAQQAKILGQSPAASIQKQAAYKADAGALNKMRVMSSSAEAFETKALAQADIVDGLSAKVNRTQYPILNEGLLAGRAQILGDANTQLLFNALTTFTTEYAKIMEGSTGSAGGSSESARAAAAKLVSAGLNKGQLAQTLELMRKEMRLTIDGYGVAMDHITTRMGGTAPPPMSGQTPASGAGLTYEDYLKSKGGR